MRDETVGAVGEEGQAHGRYYAEHVQLTTDEPREIQALLDEKDGKEWHLVGVAGVFPGGGVMLFWDTQRPSFARRAY